MDTFPYTHFGAHCMRESYHICIKKLWFWSYYIPFSLLIVILFLCSAMTFWYLSFLPLSTSVLFFSCFTFIFRASFRFCAPFRFCAVCCFSYLRLNLFLFGCFRFVTNVYTICGVPKSNITLPTEHSITHKQTNKQTNTFFICLSGASNSLIIFIATRDRKEGWILDDVIYRVIQNYCRGFRSL
jgi:hypothetical protein